MKNQLIITLALFATLSSAVITVNAQTFDEPAIKILPTSQKGILKVLYAYDQDNSNQSVTVKFLNEGGVIKSDEIKQGTFTNGFLKKYDIRKMASISNNVWIEVSSSNVTATYKLDESRDGNSFVPTLVSATQTHQFVAANR
ncbi:hypothetical protein BH09BAC3_BH09BAC3_34130 [soil metagenome]